MINTFRLRLERDVDQVRVCPTEEQKSSGD